MYCNIVENELNEFIKKYQENPFEFLTEYDIQSYIWYKIFNAYEQNNISVSIENSEDDLKVKKYNPDLKIKINPVRREYPASETFDIAIIDSSSTTKQLSAYWHQPLLVALEFKYHRSSKDYINELIKKFEQDIKKLSSYKKQNKNNQFCGIAILFIQNESSEKEKYFEDLFKSNYELIKNLSVGQGIQGFIVTKKHIFRMHNKSLERNI